MSRKKRKTKGSSTNLNDDFTLISKPDVLIVRDFIETCQVLGFLMDKLQSNPILIAPLLLQLRILLCDKSGNCQPLLQSFAKITNTKVNVFVQKGKKLPFMEHLVTWIQATPFSVYRENLPNSTEVSLEEALNLTIFHYKSQSFTLERVLNDVANKFGGAHRPQKVEKYALDATFIELFDLPMLSHLALNVAHEVLEISSIMLNQFFSLCGHMQILPLSPADNWTIISQESVNLPIGYILGCQADGKVRFSVHGMSGHSWEIISDSRFEKGFLLSIIFGFRYSKRCRFEIYLHTADNGLVLDSNTVPVFFDPNHSETDFLINEPRPGHTGAHFALGEIALYRLSLPEDRWRKIHEHTGKCFRKQKLDLVEILPETRGRINKFDNSVKFSAAARFRKDISESLGYCPILIDKNNGQIS